MEVKMKGGQSIFEIITPGQHICIYANGVVEGCDEIFRIVNHIPSTTTSDWVDYFSKPHDAGLPYSKLNPGSSGCGGSQGAAEKDAKISGHCEAAVGEK
jgi:hypothetical protein